MHRNRSLTAFASLGLTLVLCATSACRSAFIDTTLRNDGNTPLHLIEIDYPSASFGTQSLAAHSVYHYRFKVQGSGAVTLGYSGSDGKAHTVTGPTLDEGQHGSLAITIDSGGKVNWAESLTKSE